MTSFEYSKINVPDFNPLFTIQSQVHYHIVSLFPPAGKAQVLPDLFYGQCSLSGSYLQGAIFYDGLLPGIVRISAKCFLKAIITFISLKQLRKYLKTEQSSPQSIKVVINEERRPPGVQVRRYNSPVSDEIGMTTIRTTE